MSGARWYDPAAGDFTSRDTTVVSPDPDPAAGNPFAYAADEPLDMIDPSGHRTVDLPGEDPNPETAANVISTSQAVAVRTGTAVKEQQHATALAQAAKKNPTKANVSAAKLLGSAAPPSLRGFRWWARARLAQRKSLVRP